MFRPDIAQKAKSRMEQPQALIARQGCSGLGWNCQALRYLLFASPVFLLLSRTAEMNCSSPRWTVESFCFSGVKADCSLKKGRLHLFFESAFLGSSMSFATDKLTIKEIV